MSVRNETSAPTADLDGALAEIAQRAGLRDRSGDRSFPHDAFALLRATGALAASAVPGTTRPPGAGELALVRRVAGADGSVGRILDGHLNASERIAVQAPAQLRAIELPAIAAGRLTGVWGGDPVPGEGPPAQIVATRDGEVVRGVKTFCSGAGGIERAAILVRDPQGDDPQAPALVWIDVADERRVELDAEWYRALGLIASASHRVVFHDAPVIARLGGPGAIAAQPWFGRDALRTAASWAGMADTALAGALHSLAERPHPSEWEQLAAGRMRTEQQTIDAWLQRAARAMDAPDDDLAATALHARSAIAGACRRLLDEAARACGSRPFARADDLDRARRDLELFLLQHRLEPALIRDGAAAITAASGPAT